MIRKQSFATSLMTGAGEPQIIVEESGFGEEEAERRRNESPPRCLDPDSPSLDPYLLSPWRDTRKHSLPTPQCTSGITASQVRRLSERGGEGSGPSTKEAAFLATLSQAPAPQPGGRRHSVVTISKVPPTFFGRNTRRESIAAVPMGATRILPRRDSSSGLSGPPSNTGSSHNLQLDIMDDIAEIKTRKVRLKMWKTPSHERVCEVQPLEGNSMAQRYVQQQQRRFSDFVPTLPGSSSSSSSMRRRASELPRPSGSGAPAAGIVCSNTDLISILSSLTSSATEINRCGEETPAASAAGGKTLDQKRSRLKDFRSNSFDVSVLHGTGNKIVSAMSGAGGNGTAKTGAAPSPASGNWFANRHRPMWKKQRSQEHNLTQISFKFEKSKVMKTMKDSLLTRTNSLTREPLQPQGARHKVVWDDTRGTKVDAQVLGSAIEEFLTSQRGTESEAASTSAKPAVSPGKTKAGNSSKVTSWFAGGNKDEEQPENCEASICPSLKDLFVK
ncbi:uncharacterized protein kairos [Venturia canescens]|uniref:uncharacterized protein kairos n=1 Tax=Venturia canescens TaxID=32260 RepID=UPI001C9D4DB9|nr:uncharacterized protein LOC122409200 [Venturia canescens]XP_043272481.1 uncharacterized protein LOC122409200 [Venturia canescens]XP_043272482.1 uncharacterized protein LOC122409200 [Venturia canescens]XP_043272483.1 uncharacterized protein LOC122409200 [Venturia canescens]XP_043272484.1 uncharacterized protein LOC122409200 [Venturia canescens]XP_043272485.1 uncharacterized protein LOC122409200 [Venturia canescens]XP_043272487.1 uncharacterized protein LOC122409200 [Venturia canescens]XP_0